MHSAHAVVRAAARSLFSSRNRCAGQCCRDGCSCSWRNLHREHQNRSRETLQFISRDRNTYLYFYFTCSILTNINFKNFYKQYHALSQFPIYIKITLFTCIHLVFLNLIYCTSLHVRFLYRDMFFFLSIKLKKFSL